MGTTHGLRVLSKYTLIDFVHGGKVLHVVDEDVDFHHVVYATTCGLKDSFEIGESHCLHVAIRRELLAHCHEIAGLNVQFYQQWCPQPFCWS